MVKVETDSWEGQKPIGEVIQSSTTLITGECWEGKEPPIVGSIVRAVSGPYQVLAVVSEVRQTSRDPYREPTAFGVHPDELHFQQPQLSLLLRTQFTALCVGRGVSPEPPSQGLPERPIPLHSAIFPLSPKEARSFTRDWSFLTIILHHRSEVGDPLLISLCRWAYQAHGKDPSCVVAFGRALASLLKGDYPRLRFVLRQLEPLHS